MKLDEEWQAQYASYLDPQLTGWLQGIRDTSNWGPSVENSLWFLHFIHVQPSKRTGSRCTNRYDFPTSGKAYTYTWVPFHMMWFSRSDTRPHQKTSFSPQAIPQVDPVSRLSSLSESRMSRTPEQLPLSCINCVPCFAIKWPAPTGTFVTTVMDARARRRVHTQPTSSAQINHR